MCRQFPTVKSPVAFCVLPTMQLRYGVRSGCTSCAITCLIGKCQILGPQHGPATTKAGGGLGKPGPYCRKSDRPDTRRPDTVTFLSFFAGWPSPCAQISAVHLPTGSGSFGLEHAWQKRGSKPAMPWRCPSFPQIKSISERRTNDSKRSVLLSTTAFEAVRRMCKWVC